MNKYEIIYEHIYEISSSCIFFHIIFAGPWPAAILGPQPRPGPQHMKGTMKHNMKQIYMLNEFHILFHIVVHIMLYFLQNSYMIAYYFIFSGFLDLSHLHR